mgnify:CR=1 FL=1
MCYEPFFQVTWDWVILGLTFYTVVMVPFNLAVYRTSYTSTGDITFMVVDSIVDIIFLIDIIFNFHTSFVGSDGAVIVDEAKIRSELYNFIVILLLYRLISVMTTILISLALFCHSLIMAVSAIW